MTKALSRRARAQLFYEINKIEGDDHHDRNLLLLRTGRYGTCVDCPRSRDGSVYPEHCRYTRRYDHDIPIEPETRDLLRRAKGQQHNAGHYFYDTGAQALPPDGKPGGRWAVVDYAGVTRLRTRSLSAARRYARRSYIAGVVRRWHGQAVSHG